MIKEEIVNLATGIILIFNFIPSLLNEIFEILLVKLGYFESEEEIENIKE